MRASGETPVPNGEPAKVSSRVWLYDRSAVADAAEIEASPVTEAPQVVAPHGFQPDQPCRSGPDQSANSTTPRWQHPADPTRVDTAAWDTPATRWREPTAPANATRRRGALGWPARRAA